MSRPSDELLTELQPVALAIAYRMLGSVTETDDIAQDALLRLHRCQQVGAAVGIADLVKIASHTTTHQLAAHVPPAQSLVDGCDVEFHAQAALLVATALVSATIRPPPPVPVDDSCRAPSASTSLTGRARPIPNRTRRT